MRADPDQIARAKEVDLGALVARHVKLTRKGRILVGLCPFHKEKSPSFKVENGRYHCFGCGADGDAIQWVQATAGIHFRDAVVSLNGDTAPRATRIMQQVDQSSDRSTTDKVREARAIWSSAKPIQATHAEAYLRARGIAAPCNPSLRFIERFDYARGILLPVMVAAMLSPSRDVTAVQVTFLNPQKPAKASVATPRRTMGVMGDGAVRLAGAQHILGLAEGVETGLSAMQLTGVPVWCCLGAPRMPRVVIPDDVRDLHLFGDNDAPGRDAVKRASEYHHRRSVILQFPPAGAGDWNDHLQAGAF